MPFLRSGTGYLSQDDLRVHFGVGPNKQIDAVMVQWPDGSKTSLRDLRTNQIIDVRQR
jgi:murein L,D-transpeptidase YcbB/YkuD